MKIRVSMWSFLSVVHPLQISIPMYEKIILGFNKKIRTKSTRHNKKLTQPHNCILYTKYVRNTKTFWHQNKKNKHNTTTVWYSKYISSM
jgi:hypothetical protein